MKKYLSEAEQMEIEEIVRASNEVDQTDYTAPDDADLWFLSRHLGKIVSFLAVFFMGDTHDGCPVDEIMLFTLPSERGKNRAGKLYEKYAVYASQGSGEIPHVRFSAYHAVSTERFLRKTGAFHEGDELLMVRKLSGEGNLPEEDRSFRNAHSECSVKTYGDTAYIYGVRTDASQLRQGSAEALLSEVLAEISEEGAGTALLQVASLNTPAVRLYEKLSFTVAERIELWYDTGLRDFLQER